jgi:hypothetical protein
MIYTLLYDYILNKTYIKESFRIILHIFCHLFNDFLKSLLNINNINHTLNSDRLIFSVSWKTCPLGFCTEILSSIYILFKFSYFLSFKYEQTYHFSLISFPRDRIFETYYFLYSISSS